MLRIPYCLNSRFTDVTRLPKTIFYFWQRLSKSQGLVRPEGLGKLIKCSYLRLVACVTLPTGNDCSYFPLLSRSVECAVMKGRARLNVPVSSACCNFVMKPTASVVSWSEFLAADTEVLGSIPGAARFLE
jgi:hypothetical protein